MTFQPGCYIDGVRGIHAAPAMVELAASEGFELNAHDRRALELYHASRCYRNGDPVHIAVGEHVDYLVREAEWFFQEHPDTPDDHYWAWESGDWGLWPNDPECPSCGSQWCAGCKGRT